MQDLLKRLESLSGSIKDAITKLNITTDESLIEHLQAESLAPDFWNDSQVAGAKSQELAGLVKRVDEWRDLERQTSDELETLREFGSDPAYLESAAITVGRLEADFAAREFELKLSGPHDRASAILEIHAGTGGTDAQDWAEMLERMYLRYAERTGLIAEIDSISPGEEAGIKSVTIEINGAYAYGKLKGEKGVHRLVRLSPFNSDSTRQTSFALVEVLPQLDHQTDLDIDPGDLRIDVYRAGGHGGQSVNTTDSAVRITHIPSNTVVAIQNERSQLQNKEKAMAILKSRLITLMEAEQKAELSDLRAADRSADFGQQIRNYVLHPYTKVKDTRTGYETGDTQAVLNGEIDGFIEAYLSHHIGTTDTQA